ncbi:helix-turn-helix transcriptional regulator [Bradyrhizobium sp. BR 10289]|nr:helix-turn-helix transcriptional regulator [Bradyrhizobium sp. BR 10289]
MQVQESSVVACVGSLYQAAYDPVSWPDAIESLRELFNGSKACLVRTGPERGPGDLIAPNNDPAFQDRYIAEFAGEPNIVESAIARAPVGTAYSDLDFIGRETLRTSRLWNEWMAPQDMYGGLTCKLITSRQSSWFFDVQRGRNQTAFDAAELELLNMVSPHLARAVEIGRQAGLAKLVSSSLSHLPFAVLAVDAQLRVLARNEAAEQILSDQDAGLFLRRGVLMTADPRYDARLRQLVAESCAARANALPGLGGDLLIAPGPEVNDPATLAISIGPSMGHDIPSIALEPCAVVIVRRISQDMPSGFAETIARLFDLTPQEARVAANLAGGHPLKETADRIGIRMSTARSHLIRVFYKTGTSQQSQLVAMLKNVQATLPR